MDSDRLLELLDRRAAVDSLGALVSALSTTTASAANLDSLAIGIDASVFLRLGQRTAIDIVDYLDAEHSGPLVLPGQAVQEFWNNQLAVVETIATSLRKKFEALKADASKVDGNFGEFSARIESLLEEFENQYGFVYDEATKRNAIKLLETLQRKATVSYVPRSTFLDVAANRKRTRTPPGFEDGRDGDFFIWADFLYGLMQLRSRGAEFNRVVLVTNDKKIDWSRSGVPHPVLAAEIRALFDATFELWDVKQLAKAIEDR